ncbi:hypothetical protein [Aliterella atlantica]|uniref:Uncharacterized protein n=1 Tax=Aliterella atlantica CENA595 TaxID=1618023 RepID=A0A0D8ZMV0_9CYAN|nr:hypothetical protein [Aliterella atlantica]KJH70085.1 hypothetical protein UH38_20305 [Aliterella atlantica CENA595]
MVTAFKQLELDLWGDLRSALDEPQAANFHELWQELERALAPLEKNQQLQVAADAISQIIEVYVKRANGILDGLELTDNINGPVLDDDFLSGLMRQSMSLDLSDLMEDLFDDAQIDVNPGSVVTLVDKKDAQAIARQARRLAKQDLLELAGKENISLWQSAIAHWMQQHQGAKVSLWQLQQTLGMPLVEVWLGLLHSPMPYQWDGQGEFYREAWDVWISDC